MDQPKNTGKAADYEHNNAAFGGYWSGPARISRRLAYPAVTKIRRFRRMLAKSGLDRRAGLAVFDQGFGAGDMLFSFPKSSSIAGVELEQVDVETATLEAAKLGYARVDLRRFVPGQPVAPEWRGQFDVLISSHVLEHIQEPMPVLRELTGLLKPGGVACIIVPINEKVGEDANHFHWFTEQSFRGMLEGSGLIVQEMHSVDRLWRLLCPVFYRRQRHPRSIWRVLAILQNLLACPLPAGALAAIDRVLAWFGVQPRQCFAWCRRA